jgi:hypothetical protein
MKRIEPLEHWAYRLALILTLVAAARFGWAVARLGAATAADSPRSQPAPYADLPLLGPASMPKSGLAMATPEAISSAIAAAVGSATSVSSSSDKPVSPPREIINSFLSVQAGVPRSELRVNGSLVGKTPFLGQISCERGQTVRLDVLPPKGVPSHYEIPCLAGEMRLRDEP